MSDMDINFLHTMVLREAESDSIQEIDPNLYRTIAEFLGNLKRQEYDGVENKIKESIIDMAAELTGILIATRIEKASSAPDSNIRSLLDEEKFILDAQEEQHERMEIILSAATNGRSKFLESISQKHKTRLVIVRFLKNVDELIGADMEKYGPFQTEDIAAIPYENAQALISKDAVTRVRWDD